MSKVDGFKPKPCPVKCLLPHEILHSISEHPFTFQSLILGSQSLDSIRQFWLHCKNLPPWSTHPIFEENEQIPLERTIPLLLHGDGAQFYREDEMFVYSISSLLAPAGMIQDCLLQKFPFLIIPERFIRSEDVTRTQENNSFACAYVTPQTFVFSQKLQGCPMMVSTFKSPGCQRGQQNCSRPCLLVLEMGHAWSWSWCWV